MFVVGVAAAIALAQRPVSPVTTELALSTDMAESARRFLSALTPPQRARAVFAVTSDERLRWHYVPQPRPGIAFKELSDAQRALAYGFLSTALSRRGFLKATSIMALDDVLRRRDNSSIRDAGAYFLTVFGEPSTSATWGFRVEGHHLSLNLTLVDGVRPVESPAFFGANPSRVPSGFLLADTRVLGREEDLGFQLFTSLDAAQRKAATFQSAAPDDILTAPGAKLTALPGLGADRMTAAQRKIFDALLDEVAGSLPRELADRERTRIAADAPADLLFTWAGGAAAGQPHYFRLAGSGFIYELDNTQNSANHVHSVWHAREPGGGDFGVDLLRQHYTQSHAPASREPTR
ncbi:MAG TPA: DUF3500 domain-containing protein [Burkholderiaceae bacterium]|nr:DUF3500 domain-containing protein [Burkholderiaceae bacterium]